MRDLTTSARHDPGGKTRLKLPDGVSGTANLSDCGRYRPALTRDWTPAGGEPRAVLFVGLNPSVAAADVSDPTCHRELNFARDWGFTRYLKANLLDWRATSPRDIPADPDLARSEACLPQIAAFAEEAELIVLATGNVPKPFAGLYEEMLGCARASGKPLKCLGKNQSGAAKHPLYIRKDAPLLPF